MQESWMIRNELETTLSPGLSITANNDSGNSDHSSIGDGSAL